MSEEQRKDYLALITGLGAVSEDRLNAAGILTYKKLAATSSAELAAITRWDASVCDGWKVWIERLGLVQDE